jgi:2-phospho-L-lactate/phosphoenolpyruvate guanylyltransferase
MSICLVLPLKSLRDGKTRLASVLQASERAALIHSLLEHVLEQAARFPGLAQTLLVSACEEARACAAQHGAQVLQETVPGLNQALEQARMSVRAAGATRMLVVPCDLPLLTADDLRSLAAPASMQTIAVATDRSGTGTNGLCLPVSANFAFAFGVESFARHRTAVEQLGLRAVTVERAGLAFDVDTPEDLRHLRNLEQALSPR